MNFAAWTFVSALSQFAMSHPLLASNAGSGAASGWKGPATIKESLLSFSGSGAASGWKGPATIKESLLPFSDTLAYSPTCEIRAGETHATCSKGARWTELISFKKAGEGELVCGIIETKRGDDWTVFEARLYCVRGKVKR